MRACVCVHTDTHTHTDTVKDRQVGSGLFPDVDRRTDRKTDRTDRRMEVAKDSYSYCC